MHPWRRRLIQVQRHLLPRFVGEGYLIPLKSNRLAREVILHGAVIIEVVARQVSEDSNVEGDSGDASLIESVAGDFHHKLGRAEINTLSHKLEEVA